MMENPIAASGNFTQHLVRQALWLVLLACMAALGTALISQYVFGLLPCDLCILQRWPYVFAGLVAALGLVLARRPATAPLIPWLLALCAGLFMIDAGIALYHVGIEQAWWTGPADCTAGAGRATTLAELRRQILATDPVRCDEVQWSLFGISMAGYNIVACLLLALFAGWSGLQRQRTS